MVGIDYAQYQVNPSSVTFKVYLDDATEPAWKSGVMGSQTPAKKISLDITGVKKIKLVTDEGDNNYKLAT